MDAVSLVEAGATVDTVLVGAGPPLAPVSAAAELLLPGASGDGCCVDLEGWSMLRTSSSCLLLIIFIRILFIYSCRARFVS